MGRRSINTTKSGKYMNPTDQARKEARKKELKKNKRQRQMVRAAVLKGKDPAQILEEMEKIDEMEYNVFQPSPLNEKVLREKRKKLKETFDRVMRLYHNDDPELWAELKRKEVDYEKKRLKKQQYYESVKSAQSVQIDEIPLPQMNIPPGGVMNRVPPPNALHFPPLMPSGPPGSTVKRHNENNSQQQNSQKSTEKKKKEPPGCPPGPPPNLLKMRELDTDAEDDDIPMPVPVRENKKSSRHRDDNDDDAQAPTSLQKRMLAISGQNIDDFMKEMENVHRKKDDPIDSDSGNSSDEEDEDRRGRDRSKDSDSDESDSEDSDDDDEIRLPKRGRDLSIPLPPIPPPPPSMGMSGGPPPPPMGMPPSMMHFRPPPMRPGMSGMPGMRMSGPPGRPGMGMPQRLGIRMPPGPPPGMPPSRGMHHHQKGHHNNPQNKDSKGITTITAKPQIRNLSADVTRFLPSALRVKRDDHKLQRRPKPYQQEIKPTESKTGATKDDAYMQFMKEMQGLL